MQTIKTLSKKVFEADFEVRELFIIGLQQNSAQLLTALEDIDSFYGFESMFGVQPYKDDMLGDELHRLLKNNDKLGYLVQIAIPKRSHFEFDAEGKTMVCRVHEYDKNVWYCYGESLEETIATAMLLADAQLRRDVAFWKQKTAEQL